MPQTKIVCTMGPACTDEATLLSMLRSGMHVARLNFSHGTHEQHANTIRMLRGLADRLGYPLAILQDLCGPKVRIGIVPGDGMTLDDGGMITLSCRPDSGEERVVPLPFPAIIRAAQQGSRIVLDDGSIQVEVEHKTETDLVCRVVAGGLLKSKKGVNLPGASFSIESLTPKDIEDLKFGVANDVDWVAQSFVRSADDVRKLRRAIASLGGDQPIMAKIEKHEAINNLAEIVAAADGCMVARGDLGVEMALEDVPLAQKQIISACNAAGKPVVTATQMLESMIHSPQPTRAEVTDVCNAILDGTDAVMLSAETAAGAYPVESVKVMARVAERTELSLQHRQILRARAMETGEGIPDAVSEGTCEIAARLKAAAIIVATSSGSSARMVSRFRPVCPVIAASTSTKTWNRLAVSWGVRPVLVPTASSFDDTLDNAMAAAVNTGMVGEGDLVIITAGSRVGSVGSTNLIKVQVIGQSDHLGVAN